MGYLDHDVTIEDLENGRIITLRAVSQMRGVFGAEYGQEPGVVGRIGPRTGRRFSWKLQVTGETLQEARTQALEIDALIGKPLLISHRTLPGGVVWALESANPIDPNEAKATWDIEIAAAELQGWTPDAGPDAAFDLALGTITIPPLPTKEAELTPDELERMKRAPTGTGQRKCTAAQRNGLIAANLLVPGGSLLLFGTNGFEATVDAAPGGRKARKELKKTFNSIGSFFSRKSKAVASAISDLDIDGKYRDAIADIKAARRCDI